MLPIKKTLAINLRALLIDRGINETTLAANVGASNATVSDWLYARKMPRADTIDAIISYLETTPDNLFSWRNAVDRAEVPDEREIVNLEGLLNTPVRVAFGDTLLTDEEKKRLLSVVSALFEDV